MGFEVLRLINKSVYRTQLYNKLLLFPEQCYKYNNVVQHVFFSKIVLFLFGNQGIIALMQPILPIASVTGQNGHYGLTGRNSNSPGKQSACGFIMPITSKIVLCILKWR
jgi:hypothetical protein